MSRRGRYDRSLSPRQRRSAQRRLLLVAATAAFAARGFAGTTVEDVLRRARVSRRTFYEHFNGLPAALAAVHDASGVLALRAVEHALEQALEQRLAPALRVEAGVRALLQLISQNAGLARVLLGEARGAGPSIERRQAQLRAQFTALLSATLMDAHRSGAVAGPPGPLALVALVAGVEALGAHLAHDPAASLEDATREVTRLALAACGGPAPAGA